jgi:predicted metal-dependent hydrolase
MRHAEPQSPGTAELRVFEPQSVEYGSTTISYVVSHARRERVAIEVHPNGCVVVSAPLSASKASVRDVVRRRSAWILKQHRFFARLRPYTPERRFVSGESHLYLGRKYRLRILTTEGDERVKLDAGYLHIFTAKPDSLGVKQALLAAWYREHALRVLPERVGACLAHPLLRDAKPARLTIRTLTKRWGSWTPTGRLSLNVQLIRAPRACIDYVITHELCHLLVPNHSSKFTRLLDRVMPDWRDRKEQLEWRLA